MEIADVDPVEDEEEEQPKSHAIEFASGDGEVHSVDARAIFALSKTVRGMLETVRALPARGAPEASPIGLPNLTGRVMERAFDFCERHYENRSGVGQPAAADGLGSPMRTRPRGASCRHNRRPPAGDPRPGGELDGLSVDEVFDLLDAAEYLDIEPLRRAACEHIGSLVRGNTPEEIRRNFGLSPGALLPPLSTDRFAAPTTQVYPRGSRSRRRSASARRTRGVSRTSDPEAGGRDALGLSSLSVKKAQPAEIACRNLPPPHLPHSRPSARAQGKARAPIQLCNRHPLSPLPARCVGNDASPIPHPTRRDPETCRRASRRPRHPGARCPPQLPPQPSSPWWTSRRWCPKTWPSSSRSGC